MKSHFIATTEKGDALKRMRKLESRKKLKIVPSCLGRFSESPFHISTNETLLFSPLHCIVCEVPLWGWKFTFSLHQTQTSSLNTE